MARVAMWALLAVVATAAAVLSFASLRALAILCGFSPGLGFLLPVVIDAGAAAGCLAWMSASTQSATRRFARALTASLLAASVGGNAIVHGLSAYRLAPPWWLVVAVSGVAPAVLGAVVHLAVLLGRPADVAGTDASSTPSAPAAPSAVIVHPRLPDVTEPAEAVNPGRVVGGNVGGSVQDRPVTPGPDPAVLIAAGAGRRKLAAELGVSEHEARQLIERHRTNGHAILEDAR